MDTGEFGIDHRDADGVCSLKMRGELDIAHAGEVREAIVTCEGVRVVVDTTEVTFIDSTGFAALVVGRNKLGPRFELLPGDVTERLVDLSGAREFFGL